jgi:hypothetical protein
MMAVAWRKNSCTVASSFAGRVVTMAPQARSFTERATVSGAKVSGGTLTAKLETQVAGLSGVGPAVGRRW